MIEREFKCIWNLPRRCQTYAGAQIGQIQEGAIKNRGAAAQNNFCVLQDACSLNPSFVLHSSLLLYFVLRQACYPFAKTVCVCWGKLKRLVNVVEPGAGRQFRKMLSFAETLLSEIGCTMLRRAVL